MKNEYFILLIISLVFMSCSSHSTEVDICRCLNEPGNSAFMKENKDACMDAISQELGVKNWEKINMSRNPEIRSKFHALANRCM